MLPSFAIRRKNAARFFFEKVGLPLEGRYGEGGPGRFLSLLMTYHRFHVPSFPGLHLMSEILPLMDRE